MPRPLFAALLALTAFGAARAADDSLIDAMDEVHFQPPKEKGKAELIDGKVGKAVRFSFDQDARGAFFTSNRRGSPAWDKAAGLSFWVKGDGSDHFGGLELIYDDDYAVRYDYAFPLKSTEWTKIVVPWRDLVPVLPGEKSGCSTRRGTINHPRFRRSSSGSGGTGAIIRPARSPSMKSGWRTKST